MTTAISLFQGMKLPAHLQQAHELDALTKSLSGGGAATGKRISVEGGVFRLFAEGKEIAKNTDRAINIIVVNAAPNNNRVFYEGTYVKGQATAPSCSSADGVRPDARASKPQAKSCADCAQNIKGSGNGDSRACRYQRRLAVVLEGDISGDVYQLALAATSIFGKGVAGQQPLEAYASMLGHNGVSVNQVVTKMEFDTDASTPKLFFSAVRPLDDDEYEIVKEQGESAASKQAVDFGVYQQDTAGTLPAPAPAPKATPKAASGFVKAAEEVADEVVEEVVVAPVKKAAKPKPEVVEDVVPDAPVKVESPNINKLMAAWGASD